MIMYKAIVQHFRTAEARAELQAAIFTEDSEEIDSIRANELDEPTRALQAQCAELRTSIGRLPEEANKTFVLHLNRSVELLDRIGTARITEAIKDGDKIYHKVSDRAGGLLDGVVWSDGIAAGKTKSWPHVLEHANKTLMKEARAAKMRDALEALEKALG